MRTTTSPSTALSACIPVLLGVAGLAALAPSASAGIWTRLVRNAPGGVSRLHLLPDGNVWAATSDGVCYRLKPDSHGNYVNGIWTTLAPMRDTRLYYSSQVLRDGRIFVAGGEYGTGTSKAEVYDPQLNTWTDITPPSNLWNPATDIFYDSNSEMLPDGSVLIMPVGPHTAATPLRYNPATNTWSNAGKLVRGYYQDEASWVKLPDDSILTIDPFGTFSERFIPASNAWRTDSSVPVSLYDPFGSELGAAFLLPSGKAFFLGSTGHTALYTPSGLPNVAGKWVAGPDIPDGHGTPDAPAAMMVNGKILCAVSPLPTSDNHFPSPTIFYEYDWEANSFTSVPGPHGASENQPCFAAIMLDLPDGNVLYSHFGNDLYVYTPTGAPLAAGKPVISSITANPDGSFHLTGTNLNGISEGASYGDDFQMNTNYPLVRLHHSNGAVYYARTFNWSSTGVMTGAKVLTTEYRLPTSLPSGTYTLEVTANGIASDIAVVPSIASNPVSQINCGHGSASFTVVPAGTPTFSYQWRRGTTPLANDAHITGATDATLVINPVGPADVDAAYNCVVTTVLGSATSANAGLAICSADFDCTGFVDTEDYDAFVHAFEVGSGAADIDYSGFVDIEDFTAFVNAYEAGC